MEQVSEKARQIPGSRMVQTGVSKMLDEVTIEATFSDSLKNVKFFLTYFTNHENKHLC